MVLIIFEGLGLGLGLGLTFFWGVVGAKFFLPYGTGYVAGDYVNDTISLGGVSAPNTPLGEGNIVAKFFEGRKEIETIGQKRD